MVGLSREQVPGNFYYSAKKGTFYKRISMSSGVQKDVVR
jgi:hypothetical protein